MRQGTNSWGYGSAKYEFLSVLNARLLLLFVQFMKRFTLSFIVFHEHTSLPDPLLMCHLMPPFLDESSADQLDFRRPESHWDEL